MSIFPDHRKVSAPPLVNLISLNCIRFPSLSLTFVLLSEGMSGRSEQRGIEKTFFPLRCFLMMVAMLKKLSASFSVIDYYCVFAQKMFCTNFSIQLPQQCNRLCFHKCPPTWQKRPCNSLSMVPLKINCFKSIYTCCICTCTVHR